MDGLRTWARQPTTVAGLSAVIAAVTALTLRQLDLAQAVPILAGAVMSMLLPDNSAAQQQAGQLAGEVVSRFKSEKEADK